MTTDFSMTARDMVTQAMREIGVIASGEQPTSDEMADGLLRLNSMLKSMAAKGLNLWRDTEGTAAFPAGTATITLAPRPITVSNARVSIGGYDRFLNRWEVDDYAMIPNKGTRGTPVSYTLRETVAGTAMTLWPVPDADTTISYSYGRVSDDATESAAVDIPQMFQEAIWTMLAVRLAPTFGKARTDPQTVQLVMARAAELERDLLDFDRPAAYQLGPDLDGYP